MYLFTLHLPTANKILLKTGLGNTLYEIFILSYLIVAVYQMKGTRKVL